MNSKKSFFHPGYKVAAAVVFFLVGASVIFAWTPPNQAPPLGNVAAPLNVSATYQQKTGQLGAAQMRANQYCDLGGGNCFTAASQVAVSCPAGQAIRAIAANGTPTCTSTGGGGGGGGGAKIVTQCGSCPSGCSLLNIGGKCSTNNDYFICGCN